MLFNLKYGVLTQPQCCSISNTEYLLNLNAVQSQVQSTYSTSFVFWSPSWQSLHVSILSFTFSCKAHVFVTHILIQWLVAVLADCHPVIMKIQLKLSTVKIKGAGSYLLVCEYVYCTVIGDSFLYWINCLSNKEAESAYIIAQNSQSHWYIKVGNLQPNHIFEGWKSWPASIMASRLYIGSDPPPPFSYL